MIDPLDWFLARRYLSSRKGGRLLSFITWIALGGVVVGVTALVVVIGVMTGMQEDLRDKILASHPHVLVLQQGASLRMEEWRSARDTVAAVDGVVSVSPFVLTNVVAERAGYQQPALLYGVPTDPPQEGAGPPPTDLEADIRAGVLELEATESGLPPVLLGSGLASRMQILAGDTVRFLSMENADVDLIFGVRPVTRSFEVVGTFTTGMYDADIKNAYTPVEAAQSFAGYAEADDVSGLAVRVRDADLATPISRDIEDRLGLPYVAQSWTVSNAALFSALKLEKIAMFVILLLIVVVAAFNIISTLVMVVADRTREIGILKSMGMTDGGILRVFMLQGAWIGIVGTTVGTLLGLLLCWIIDTFDVIRIPPEVYFVDRLPVELHLWDLLAIVGASIVVAFAATIYPSLQAASLEPVEAIRSE